MINIGVYDVYPNGLGITVFSEPNRETTNILIPDYYSMGNYDNKLKLKDEIYFEQKQNIAFFIGSTTGNADPICNDRLKLCNTYKNHPYIKCYINNICQMSVDSATQHYPDYPTFVCNNISIKEQLLHPW